MTDWQNRLLERSLRTLPHQVERFAPEQFPDLALLLQASDN